MIDFECSMYLREVCPVKLFEGGSEDWRVLEDAPLEDFVHGGPPEEELEQTVLDALLGPLRRHFLAP